MVEERPAAPYRVPPTLRRALARFPNSSIISNPVLERRVIFWVWLTVPLQYYVLTRIAGGQHGDEWAAIAISVLSCMLLILGISSSLARIFPMRCVEKADDCYEVRLRAWSVALITTWTAAVTLIAGSYLIAPVVGIETGDLVHVALCKFSLNCPNHPEISAPSSYAIYFVYSFAAILLVFVIVRAHGGATESAITFPGPHTAAVLFIVTILLNVLYSVSKLN
jgi:hypothetical protein